jgi:hypothetical protein
MKGDWLMANRAITPSWLESLSKKLLSLSIDNPRGKTESVCADVSPDPEKESSHRWTTMAGSGMQETATSSRRVLWRCGNMVLLLLVLHTHANAQDSSCKPVYQRRIHGDCRGEMEVAKIILGDAQGTSEVLCWPRFSFGEELTFVLSGKTRRQVRIQLPYVKKAAFRETKNGIEVSVILSDDTVVDGRSTGGILTVEGESRLGTLKYTLKKKCSIQIMEWMTYEEGIDITGGHLLRRPLDQQTASSERARFRSEFQQRHFGWSDDGVWRVCDGVDSLRGTTVWFREYYVTNKGDDGKYYVNRRFPRLSAPSNAFNFRVGDKVILMSLREVDSLAITGKQIDGHPEAVVRKKNGNKFQGVVLDTKAIFEHPDGKSQYTYGAFDDGDCIGISTWYGGVEIPLVPPRQITITRDKN